MDHAQAPEQEQEWPDNWFIRQDTCLYCGSTHLQPLIDGVADWYFHAVPGSFAFLRCANCRSLLLDRRPTDEHLGKAYRNYYTHAGSDNAAAGGGLVRQAWRVVSGGYVASRYGRGSLSQRLAGTAMALLPARRLELDAWYRFLPAHPCQVLDYGCGNGDFLVRARDLGHQVCGTDLDPAAVAVACQRGLDVIPTNAIVEGEFAARFDHITANHVLEHVPDPLALLAAFRRWLKPGGSLYLELPNGEAAGIARDGVFWRGFEAPRHFALPSRAGLLAVLEQAGFDQVMFHRRAFLSTGMARTAQAAANANPAYEAGSGRPVGCAGSEFLTVTAKRT